MTREELKNGIAELEKQKASLVLEVHNKTKRIAELEAEFDALVGVAEELCKIIDDYKKQKAIDIKKVCDAYCMESCGHPRANCDCMSRMNIQKTLEEQQ